MSFYSRHSHFFSWWKLLTSYMSTFLWIYLKSFFLPSIWLHSTGTLRQHGLFGSNTVENSCGFWTEWLDQAGIQQKELEKGKIETLSFFAFYNISMPVLVLGGHHNTEAHAYNVEIKNTYECWNTYLAFKLDHVRISSAGWRDHQPLSFAPPMCLISTCLFK